MRAPAHGIGERKPRYRRFPRRRPINSDNRGSSVPLSPNMYDLRRRVGRRCPHSCFLPCIAKYDGLKAAKPTPREPTRRRCVVPRRALSACNPATGHRPRSSNGCTGSRWAQPGKFRPIGNPRRSLSRREASGPRDRRLSRPRGHGIFE